MALDFPSSPNSGATYTASGVTWVWDGSKWEPSATASGPFVPLSGATMAGPLLLFEDPQVALEAATKEYVDAGDIATAASITASIPANYPLNSNRIINGDMRIDQRNASTGGTAINVYTCDRWSYGATVAAKGTWSRASALIPPNPVGFPYAWKFLSSSAYASLASDQFDLYQPIEADMISDFNFGTANAQPITLSFWVFVGIAGIYSGAFQNYTQTRSYPFSYSIPVANTWTKITLTIPGDTSGTWVMSGNGGAAYLLFDLGSGSNFHGPANTWANGSYLGVAGSISIVGTNGAQILITGVKLEIGSVATPFNYDSLAKRLADCQRYYQIVSAYWSGNASSGSAYYALGWFPVTPRAAPTLNGISQIGAPAFPNAIGTLSGGANSNTFVCDSRVCSTTTTGGIFATVINASAEL